MQSLLFQYNLERANGDRPDDSSSDFESDSSDEEIPIDQVNQMVRCSVNVDFQEEEVHKDEHKEDHASAGQLGAEDDRNQSSRFRSYLDGHLQDVSFEREYDKKEAEQQNTISLDEGERQNDSC